MIKKEKKISLKRQNLETIIEIATSKRQILVKDAMRLIMNSEWVSSYTAKNRIKDLILMQKVAILRFDEYDKKWYATYAEYYHFEDCLLVKPQPEPLKKES